MITTREVIEIENGLRQEPSRDQLVALLEAAADGLQETYLNRVATYNRLHGVISEIIDRLVAEDPATLLKDLMHHPHPRVFAMATAKYYWKFDEQFAEETARAIADAHPDPSPLGKQAREIVNTFEFNRKWESSPSDRAASAPPEPSAPPPQAAPVLRIVDRQQLETIAVEADCEELVPVLKDLAWPSLRLKRSYLDADVLPIGESKLGGCPDMPVTEAWPRFRSKPLAFRGNDVAGLRYRPHVRASRRGVAGSIR